MNTEEHINMINITRSLAEYVLKRAMYKYLAKISKILEKTVGKAKNLLIFIYFLQVFDCGNAGARL